MTEKSKRHRRSSPDDDSSNSRLVVIPLTHSVSGKRVMRLEIDPEVLGNSIRDDLRSKYPQRAAVINKNRMAVRKPVLKRAFPDEPDLAEQIKRGVSQNPGDLPEKWSEGGPPIIIAAFKRELPHVLTVLREQAFYSMQFVVDFSTLALDRDGRSKLAQRCPMLALDSFGLMPVDVGIDELIEWLEELVLSFKVRAGQRMRGEREEVSRSPDTRAKMSKSHIGKRHSPESRTKISKKRREQSPLSEAAIANIRAKMLGNQNRLGHGKNVQALGELMASYGNDPQTLKWIEGNKNALLELDRGSPRQSYMVSLEDYAADREAARRWDDNGLK